MNDTFNNIVLVCLDGKFSRLISEELSDKLDMFFADLKAYIEYDLLDSQEVLEKCGINYLLEREQTTAKNFARFENSILTVDFDLFKQNRSAFTKQSLIVYLYLQKKSINKEEAINRISFDSRSEYLQKESNLTIELKSKAKSKAVKEIMLKLGEAL